MKVLTLILVASIAGAFVFQHAIPCWKLPRQPNEAEDYYQALRAIEELRIRKPCLCPAEVSAAFKGTLERAVRNLLRGPQPDFHAASELLARYQDRVRGAPDLESLARELRDRHLKFVRTTDDFARAVAELEDIRSFYADPATLAAVAHEEPYVYFRHAQALAAEGRHEDALTALRRVVSLDAAPARLYEKARQLAVAAAGQGVRDRIAQRRFDSAFRLLRDSQINFPGTPMEQLAASIDREVFGQPRVGAPRPLPAPVRQGTVQAGMATHAMLMVDNHTGSALRVAYRGPTVRDVVVAPGCTQQVQLEPGAYLIAVFGTRDSGPAHFRGEYRVPPGNHTHTIVDVPEEGMRLM